MVVGSQQSLANVASQYIRMTQLIQRPYRPESDPQRMADLARVSADSCVHVVDLPYRLCSWAFDDPLNGALWEDAGGDLLGWAALQAPFWAIDFALRPGAPPELLAALLAWADGRARAVRETAFGRPAWFLNAFADQHGQRGAFAQAGFADQGAVAEDAWSKVLFTRPADQPVPHAPPPAGCALRPLAGAAEVPAYVALHRAVFGSPNMTAAWRERTLRHPDYRPELDLVAVDPAGDLAAFCVGWFTPRGREGLPSAQIEPFGVREDMQRQGLGRALLAECLRRTQGLGAQHLAVETDNYRDAAYRFYESLGFVVSREIVVYRKG